MQQQKRLPEEGIPPQLVAAVGSRASQNPPRDPSIEEEEEPATTIEATTDLIFCGTNFFCDLTICLCVVYFLPGVVDGFFCGTTSSTGRAWQAEDGRERISNLRTHRN